MTAVPEFLGCTFNITISLGEVRSEFPAAAFSFVVPLSLIRRLSPVNCLQPVQKLPRLRPGSDDNADRVSDGKWIVRKSYEGYRLRTPTPPARMLSRSRTNRFSGWSVSTQVASAEEFQPMPSRCPCDRFGDP